MVVVVVITVVVIVVIHFVVFVVMVIVDSRHLSLKFGQNLVINDGNIADIEFLMVVGGGVQNFNILDLMSKMCLPYVTCTLKGTK